VPVYGKHLTGGLLTSLKTSTVIYRWLIQLNLKTNEQVKAPISVRNVHAIS